MGLDITFYKRSKENTNDIDELIFFNSSRCDFIMRYFMIDYSNNGEDVVISKSIFEQFKNDLDLEINNHKFTFEEIDEVPNNIELLPYKYSNNIVGFCDKWYWQELCSVSLFVNNIIKIFNWDKYDLIINCDW